MDLLRRRVVVPLGLMALALSCIADITGAPCATSDTCPNGQYCSNGRCAYGSAGTGGGTSGGTLTCKGCSGAADSSCGVGSDCRQRLCDGKWGCLPLDAGIDACATVAGATCPAVSPFGACTSASQCGAGATCLRGRCFQVGCAANADCVFPNFAQKQLTPGRCVAFSDTDKRCYPYCVGLNDTSCPSGSACEAFASGTYGYCEVPAACQACVGGACSSGAKCLARTCDGLLGCFPNDDPYCDTIGGKVYPSVCNFLECPSSSTVCGSQSACITGTGNPRCLQKCVGDTDCVESKAFGSLTAVCTNLGSVGSFCMPKCTAVGDTTCPTGTTCAADANRAGTFFCDY